jgi:type IV secretion system protein VirB9
MKPIVIACLLFLATSLPLGAETLPAAGEGDPRIRVATYSPDEVYRLYAAVGYDLRLEFSNEEQFVSVDGGDLDAITYSAHDHVFSFKPRTALADTNLAISTSRRSYYFRYSTISDADLDTHQPVMYVVRFRYPPEMTAESIAQQRAHQIDKDLAQAPASRPQNGDYWYCGAPSLRPVAASDDGVHTRLAFSARTELPALFVRNADGSESLLNFSIEGGDVVIHRVAAQFVVRRGRLTGCIVNKGFAGSGTRLESGTVSPVVTRDTKAPHP